MEERKTSPIKSMLMSQAPDKQLEPRGGEGEKKKRHEVLLASVSAASGLDASLASLCLSRLMSGISRLCRGASVLVAQVEVFFSCWGEVASVAR